MSNIGCILYPPTLDYNYLVQRPQQMMKNFSEIGITSYYINNPGPNSMAEKGVEQLNPNFYVFNKVDPRPYLAGIKPVVYYTSAAQVNLIKQYNPCLVIFDSVDEPSDEFEAWKPYYNQAVQTADIVLTTSDKLFENACMLNANTYLIPNGCDFEHFSRTDLPVPADIANVSRPIIGYIGVVASWVDLELICAVADRFPNYNIVVVGPLYNINDVPRRNNIHWLDYKSYDLLPAYAQMFDVGIIPFRKSNMIEAVNPIKMWEYMAMGMPVVTTDIPEARKYPGLVYAAVNDEQFMNHIEYALCYDSLENRSRRLFLAQENSWRNRALLVAGIIESALAQKGIDSIPVPAPIDTVAAGYENVPEFYGISSEVFVSSLAPYRHLKVGRRVAFRINAAGILELLGGHNVKYSVQLSSKCRLNIIGKASFKFKTPRAATVVCC